MHAYSYLLKNLSHFDLLCFGAVVLNGDYDRIVREVEGIILERGRGRGMDID